MKETSTENNIRRNIERILVDNNKFLKAREYCTRTDVVKYTCDTAKRNCVITNENYKKYIDILKKVDEFRKLDISKNNDIIAKKDHIDNMVFWKK